MTFYMALSWGWYSSMHYLRSMGSIGTIDRAQEVDFRACKYQSCTEASTPWVTDVESRKPRSGEPMT